MKTGKHRSMRSGRFGQAVIGTAATNTLTVLAATATGLVVARLLGSSGRGTYAAVLAYVLVAAAICELGLTASICYNVARRREDAADVVRTGILTILVCGTFAGTFGYWLAPEILGHHAAGTTALRIAFAAEPMVFLGGAWVSAIQAVDIRSWNAVRLSQPAFYLIAMLLVSYVADLDVVTVTIAFVLSVSAQCGLAWWVRRRQIGSAGTFRPDFLRPMLRYGLANTASRIPYLGNTRLDQLVLAVAVTPAALGNYAVAVTLSLAAAPLSTAFGSVALPRIAEAEHGKQNGLLTKSVVGSLVIGAPASLLICGAAPLIIPSLLGPSYGDVAGLLWVLAPGAVVYGSNKVMGDVLRGLDRSIAVAYAEAAGLVVTVLLLLLLLPVIGVLGAAIASTASYLVAFMFLLRALLKHTGTTFGRATLGLQRSGVAAFQAVGARRRDQST